MSPTQSSFEPVRRVLVSVGVEIAVARETTNGIVFVVHRPGKTARAAMATLGARVRPNATTVFGVKCGDLSEIFAHDFVTRRWTEVPPLDGQIKVFLFSGEGTAQLTLHFEDGGIRVVKEPDVYGVPIRPTEGDR